MKLHDGAIKRNNVFGKAIVKAGQKNENMVVIDADLARATQTEEFKRKFPHRYFDIGIAEQNLLSIAAGFAVSGKIPFVGTFATFITKRACDQINVSIAYPKLNVKIIGIEPGLSSGRNGATHQSVDDLAIMRAIPNITVMEPCDSTEIEQSVLKALEYEGPVYMRMQRGDIPVIFDPNDYNMEIGKGIEMFEGNEVCLISSGIMTVVACEAINVMRKNGINAGLINIHTIKPLDKDIIISAAQKYGAFVTCENHSIIGGLGSAVAEICAQYHPVPIEMVGIKDLFGETGSQQYLMKKYGLTKDDILSAAKKAISRKRINI